MSFESSLHIMTFNRCQGYQVLQGNGYAAFQTHCFPLHQTLVVRAWLRLCVCTCCGSKKYKVWPQDNNFIPQSAAHSDNITTVCCTQQKSAKIVLLTGGGGGGGGGHCRAVYVLGICVFAALSPSGHHTSDIFCDNKSNINILVSFCRFCKCIIISLFTSIRFLLTGNISGHLLHLFVVSRSCCCPVLS